MKKGALIFVAGQPAHSAFTIRNGRVKLSVYSRGGRAIILRIAEAGDIIGLASVIAGADYDSTAEVLEDCTVEVIRRDELLASLEDDRLAAQRAVLELSRRCLAERQLIASLASADPVFVRLARLLLGWSENGNGNGNGGPRQLRNGFTHQQIADMIGTSRETVTRTLREMRERDLISKQGTLLVIQDPGRLRLVTGEEDSRDCGL